MMMMTMMMVMMTATILYLAWSPAQKGASSPHARN